MRILDRYLLLELWKTFFAVLMVLILVIFGTQASELLVLAMQGRIAPDLLGVLLLLKVPPALNVVLPLSILLASLLTFGRLYQDQEMVVLQSCGVSSGYFKRQVLIFALPVVVFALVNSTWLAPSSERQARVLLTEVQTKQPFAAIQPGRFNPLGQGGVFYLSERDAQGVMYDLWLRYPVERHWVSISAPEGRFKWIEGRLALALKDAWVLEGVDQPEVKVRHFETFEGFVPALDIRAPAPSVREQTLDVLWAQPSPKAQAMLHQQLLAPISVLVMALVGLVMSRTRPREGRFAKVFLALVVYVLYTQLVMLFLDKMIHESVQWRWALWLVPVGFLVWAVRRRL